MAPSEANGVDQPLNAVQPSGLTNDALPSPVGALSNLSPPDIAAIAKGLTKAQRGYILAVAAHGIDYHPRHGVTANWALRRGIVDTMIHFDDGRTLPWDECTRPLEGDYIIGGQLLTPLGLSVRAYLMENGDE